MICKSCNSPIEDGDVFCPNCGHKWDEDPVGIEECLLCKKCNSPISDKDVFCPNCGAPCSGEKEKVVKQRPVVVKEKKSSPPVGKKKFFVFLLILVCISALFWKPLFFAVAPDKYMSLLVKNTFNDISEEAEKISKNVLGFKLSPDKSFMAEVDFELYDAYNDVAFDFQAANFPKKKNFLVKGNFESDDYSTPFEGFLNDEEVGVSLAGTDDDFLTVPSKEFGEGFEDSDYVADHVNKDTKKILSDMNLSYSNIMGLADKNSKFSKRLKKHISTNIQEFFKDADIGKRESTKYSFGNKTVSANKIVAEYESDQFYDFLTNLAEDVKNDKKMHSYIGEEAIDALLDAIDEKRDDSSNHTVQMEVIEYKGKIVSLSFTEEIDEDDYWDKFSGKSTITISAGDKKNLLESVTISTVSEYSFGQSKNRMNKQNFGGEITFVSNWVDEDEEITASINNLENVEFQYKDDDYHIKSENEDDIEINFDFKKGKWSCDIASKYKDSNGRNTNKKSYEGDCSKKDGFTFSVGNEWTDGKWVYYGYYDERYKKVDAHFDLEVTFRPKADLKISDGEHINIFEWDEDDFEDFAREAKDEMRN